MKDAPPGSRLIIICGLPGSGKTSLAKLLAAKTGALRFSADDWIDALSPSPQHHHADLLTLWWQKRKRKFIAQSRSKIEALQWDVARHLLALGATVIIESGAWTKAERESLRIESRNLGAAVELRYLSAPLDVLLQRLQQRGHSPIKRRHFLRWASDFEPPTPEELTQYDPPLAIPTP